MAAAIGCHLCSCVDPVLDVVPQWKNGAAPVLNGLRD